MGVGDFVEVTTKSHKSVGFPKGMRACITGSGATPLGKNPYNFRTKFLIAKVVDGHVLIDDKENKMALVDPKSISPLAEQESAELKDTLIKDFPQEVAPKNAMSD